MANIGDSERKTQNRVVKFFRDKLHYTYLGNLHDSENRNIMQERLHAWLLKQGYSEKLAANAVDALVKASTNLQQGLYHANKEVYSLLKYGAKVKESVEQSPKTVYFIDFEDVSKNDFYIAEEVTIVSNNTKRPDVVIYVNGIAVAVIELKKSSVSVSNGIRQNLTNQKSNFIEDFFTTIQFCMAGNDSEGLRYGTLLTSEKHYLEWKGDGFTEHQTERDTTGAFESYDAEDVDGLLKDRATEAKKYFVDTLEELDELCEGVELPRKELDYIHYFCGESGRDENQDEAFARIREKLYKLVGRLIRAFAELKPRMTDLGYTLSEQSTLDDRVAFYVNMRDTIGRASGDFIDLKAYEPGMRYLIDNYISASESQKIGSMDDFTLLDFIISQENKLKSEQKGEQESAAETIENNIRKKVVERMVINPAYYAKMSEILEQLILDRRRGVIAYGQLLDTYMELAKNVAKPEENSKYPESIRSNGALRALYDNCEEDEVMALKLHRAIVKARLDGFRNNPVKANKIKRALYQLLNDDSEVERIYQIVVEQEEY